ncbi:hypothetical protein AHAS_Ahas05G0168700 [Arachis hypogaea]
MADCLSFVTNGSTTTKPEGNCCSGLKSVLKTAPQCLCEAFKSSAQFGVVLNVTKALALPAACKVSAPSASNCGLSETPAAAPVYLTGLLMESLKSTSTFGGSRWKKKQQLRVTSQKPFNLRTECLVKPPVKEITQPIDLQLHSDVRAMDRAEFDHQVLHLQQFPFKLNRQHLLLPWRCFSPQSSSLNSSMPSAFDTPPVHCFRFAAATDAPPTPIFFLFHNKNPNQDDSEIYDPTVNSWNELRSPVDHPLFSQSEVQGCLDIGDPVYTCLYCGASFWLLERILIWIQRERDRRVYNYPSCDEVAALVVGDFDSSDTGRDVIVKSATGQLQRIYETHALYWPLQYPLLFPYGEDGIEEAMRRGDTEASSIGTRVILPSSFTGGMYTIEFQKRGLPHAHILLWLDGRNRLQNIEIVDELICAELPNPMKFPHLYSVVSKYMIHGPCGRVRPTSPCMKDGRCSKFYPKQFVNYTSFDEDGYPIYKRRDIGVTVKSHGVDLDNRFVVPYNPLLLMKYQAHINLKFCNKSNVIKRSELHIPGLRKTLNNK